eukprot:4675977-Pyramimonas_sp.AAC.1
MPPCATSHAATCPRKYCSASNVQCGQSGRVSSGMTPWGQIARGTFRRQLSESSCGLYRGVLAVVVQDGVDQ